MGALAEQVPSRWRKRLEAELSAPYFQELEAFVESERREHTVLPAEERMFAALAHTPPEQVKVVLLGQDPYPNRHCANGLAFSVYPDQPVPGSLRNMFKVLQVDVGIPKPANGNLEPWADRGVLLLNTVLTVREGEPHSHKNKGWERFTRAVLESVATGPVPVVFLLLGKHAQTLCEDLDLTCHAVVAAPHPSPASPGNPFGKTRPFSAVNEALKRLGREPVDWSLPPA